MADPTLCVDTRFKPHSERFGLEKCMKDEPGLGGEQTFHLTWRKDIRAGQRPMCWDVPGGDQQAPVFVWDCHGQLGNQYWLYDVVSGWGGLPTASHRTFLAVSVEGSLRTCTTTI